MDGGKETHLRRVEDTLTHFTALLAADTDPAHPVARDLLRMQDLLPQPGRTVLLRPHLEGMLSPLYSLLRSILAAGSDSDQASLANLANWLAIWLSELGRRAEALAPAEEAVALRRALAARNPDAFQPDLAWALAGHGETLLETGQHADAFGTLAEAITNLRPHFCKLPEAFTFLMRPLVSLYLEAAQRAQIEPDLVLLAPILEILQRLDGDALDKGKEEKGQS